MHCVCVWSEWGHRSMVGLSLNLRADRSLALNFMWLPWRLNWYLSTLKVNMELAFGMAIDPATVSRCVCVREREREREKRPSKLILMASSQIIK